MARKHGLLPSGDTFEFLGVVYSMEHALHELEVMDTSMFTDDNLPLTEGATVIRRRTPACALRLFQIILGNDTFYARLQEETESKLSRPDLDRGAIGGNSDFWTDVLAAYLDESFSIGPPLMKHPTINNPRTKLPYDLTKVSSPWVSSAKLRDWYVVAKRAFTQYKLKYDVSGEHTFAFLSDAGLNHFAANFATNAQDVIYLAGCCHARGKDCVEFFSAKMPENVDTIDGMVVVPGIVNANVDSKKPPSPMQKENDDFSPAAKERAKLVRQKLRKFELDAYMSKKKQKLSRQSDLEEELTTTYERIQRVSQNEAASSTFLRHLEKKAAELEQRIVTNAAACDSSSSSASLADSERSEECI